MMMHACLTRRALGLALMGIACHAHAQTFDATRIDGRPAGHSLDTGGSDPIIDPHTFNAFGAGVHGDNINGPSLIRVPDWITPDQRIDATANYYLYFADHQGDSIRLAWSASLTGDWNLFNHGSAPDRAWGTAGSHTGTQTPGHGVLDLDIGNSNAIAFDGPGGFGVNNHIASPDVFVDDVNQRIVMYFHGPNGGAGPGSQQTFVTTSAYGLNFNTLADGGEAGHGPRDVIPTDFYARAFTVGGQTFAFSNQGELWQAPATNAAGDPNTLANADTEGGLWNPVGSPNDASYHWQNIAQADNPLQTLYADHGQGAADPRHVAIYQRDHLDPADTNVYLFYSAKNDTPESIFLTVIDTDGGSTSTADWSAVGQRVMLEPTLDWEGGDLPLTTSSSGNATNVRQLRDPAVFEDTDGTVYLLYTGQGEEAIGLAELSFDAFTLNTASPQGDLFETPPPPPTADGFRIDFDGVTGPTQAGHASAAASAGNTNGNLLETVTTVLPDPYGQGNITVSLTADRWKLRNPIDDANPADAIEALIRDFGGPQAGTAATLTVTLPAGHYGLLLTQHEATRTAPEHATLFIHDADGSHADIPMASSFGTDPASVVQVVYAVRSDGVGDVVLTLDNTDSSTLNAYPINGLSILLAGDADGDGVVGTDDLAALAANWQQPGAGWAGADFNGDQITDALDLDLLRMAWEQTASGVSLNQALSSVTFVPEPTSLAALLVVGPSFLFPRRRDA